MSDLISRQATIDKFEPWLKVSGYSEGELNMLKAILYELRFMPSVQPQLPEWAQKVEECRQSAPSYIHNPLAWALYQTWKEYDR